MGCLCIYISMGATPYINETNSLWRWPEQEVTQPPTDQKRIKARRESDLQPGHKWRLYHMWVKLVMLVIFIYLSPSSPLPLLPLLLSSGGPLEKPSDHWGPHLLQLPGGSWDGVPGFQEGVLLTPDSLCSDPNTNSAPRMYFISDMSESIGNTLGCSGIYDASLISPLIGTSTSAFIKMTYRSVCLKGLPGSPAAIAARL